MAKKIGCQTPTKSVVLPFAKSKGNAAIKLYKDSKRTPIKWQTALVKNIMAVDSSGLWVHQKFGYSVPRRNGKNEIVSIRELWGLVNGETMCHTAHRTTTSHSAWERLRRLLSDSGYIELGRLKKDEEIPEKSYRTTKQYGLESIKLTGGGEIVFRTRTPNGGLGEGFDLLVIDEAQEYTDAQETALIYTVSDSANPQTIFCGTPPTASSSGTVFVKMRESVLAGESYDAGWAEWSIDDMTKDVYDVALWYRTNPSMGYHLTERKIRSEIRGDIVDFNIQRLGVWLSYNQKSAIAEGEWKALELPAVPPLKGRLYAGIKFGHDGTNVSVSIAAKTKDDRIFVECLACNAMRKGFDWIVELLKHLDLAGVAIDGANGQKLLADAMKEARLKASVMPTVKEFIAANAAFEQAVFAKTLCHKGQPQLVRVVSNCDHRSIGTGGGFGYKALHEDDEIAILESTVLAHWLCSESKEGRKQRISY